MSTPLLAKPLWGSGMRFLRGIPVATTILLLTMGLGTWVDVRNDRIHNRQLEIETRIHELIRLKQEMGTMLQLSAVGRNPLRHTGYERKATELAQTAAALVTLTKDTALASEVKTIDASHARFQHLESSAIALMDDGRWDAARRLIFDEEYQLNLKVFSINADAAVMAMTIVHAKDRDQLETLRLASLASTLASLGLLLWVGRQFSHRLKDEITHLRQSEAALAVSEGALRRLSAHQRAEVEADRKRMAQEIHDELGQRLTVLRIDTALLPRMVQPDPVGLLPGRVAALKEGIDGILTIVRDLSGKLHPATLEIGLAAAAAGLVQEFRDTLHIPCDFDNQLPAGLLIDEGHATGMFRILQESLTNAARHAHADHIAVRLSFDHGQLRLEVRDDGRGFVNTPARSFGLSGMHERAVAMGGTVTVRSAINAGTTVEALIPLDLADGPAPVRQPVLPGDDAETSPAVGAPSAPAIR